MRQKAGWLTKHERGQNSTVQQWNKHSRSASLSYLPWAEVQRGSSWGAATSLPLPFRDRALESAAVASRYREHRQKWRYFPVYFFTVGVKETADIVDRAAERSFPCEVDYADPQCPLDGRQFRSANGRPECSSPSAFVAWQQGEPQLTDS